MSFPDGTVLNESGGLRMKRLANAIPAAYSIFKIDGDTYAETNIAGGTNYDTTGGDSIATVIQNAIAACTNGGKIALRGSDFNIGTTQLVLDNYVHLIGMGANTTSITYSGTAEAIVIKHGTDHCYWAGLKDLKINAGTSATCGVRILNGHYHVLDDVNIQSSGADVPGIEIDATTGKFSSSNYLLRPRICGFQFGVRYDAVDANACNHNILFGGSIARGGATDAGSRGLDVLNGNANFVFGPDLDEFETGLYCDAASNQFFAVRMEATAGTNGVYFTANATQCVCIAPRFSGTITTKRTWLAGTDCIHLSGEGDDSYMDMHLRSIDGLMTGEISQQYGSAGDLVITQSATTGAYKIILKSLNASAAETDRITIPSNTDEVAIDFHDNVLKNLKNSAASGLSGAQKDIEIDIGGVPYYFTVYPTKA